MKSWSYLVMLLSVILVVLACANDQVPGEKRQASLNTKSLTNVPATTSSALGVTSPQNTLLLSAGDTVGLSKDQSVIVVTDNFLTVREAKIDTAAGGSNDAFVIVTDDLIMLRPGAGGIELDTISTGLDSLQLVVTANLATPASVNKPPTHILTLDESLLMMDHYSLKAIGYMYDRQTSSSLKGVWEFGIGELDKVIFPSGAYQTGKKELWLYLDD